jgi:adenosylcobinamide hydrolase
VKIAWTDAGALHAAFPEDCRCLSSAVLNGGFVRARHWLNLQVPHDYQRTDPAEHVADVARAHGLVPGSVVGMLTAADIRAAVRRDTAQVRTVATVGIGQPLAAAGRRPRSVARAGTINLLVVVDAALTDAALVAAVQTATEAKAQALADAGVRALNHAGTATGTATDAVCIAARPGESVPFAGPATTVGAAIAGSVHAAVLEGARKHGRAAREAGVA